MADRPGQRRVGPFQPTPAPCPTIVEPSSSAKAATENQKLTLFIRGKAISGEPIISGTIQLPNPPIIAGMITKNTMISPWAVTMTLYS